jgi:hypothetical protein
VGDDEIQDEAGDTLEFTGGFTQNKRMYYYEGAWPDVVDLYGWCGGCGLERRKWIWR